MKPRSMRPGPVIPPTRPQPQQIAKGIANSSRARVAITPSAAPAKRSSSTGAPQLPTTSLEPMGKASHPNPPKQESTPSAVPCPVTETQYEVVVQEILSRVPLTIRSEFERSRDPRLLFPFALDGSKKKVLCDWLDAHYFIPKDLLTPVPASKSAGGADPLASGFTTSSGNNHTTHAASSAVPNKAANVCASTFATEMEASRKASSAMRDLTNTLTSFRISETDHRVPPPPCTKSPLDSGEWTAITPLLEISGQRAPHDFNTFASSFPTEDIHTARHRGRRKSPSNMGQPTWKKIGEASFSEVFRVGEVVLKIIPLEYRSTTSHTMDERSRGRRIPRPSTSLPEDVVREINATRIMSSVHSGFTRLLWFLQLSISPPK